MTLVDYDPTVDAASYWTAFADVISGSDRVEVLMAQRRRAAAYTRPSASDRSSFGCRGRSAQRLANNRQAGMPMAGPSVRARGTSSQSGPWRTWSTISTYLSIILPPRRGLALARATIEALRRPAAGGLAGRTSGAHGHRPPARSG